MATSFLPFFPIPIKHLEIGTFVLNPADPLLEKFTPAKSQSDLEPEVANIEVLNYTDVLANATSKSLRALLTQYLSASAHSNNHDVTQLSAWKAASYQMQNSTSWFKTACAAPSTQSWLEEQIGRDMNVYLLVGFRTLFDGNLKCEGSNSGHKELKTQIPIDKITGMPLGLDAGVSGSSSRSQGSTRAFMTEGESIWALQYRKLKFNWFFSRTVDKAFLEEGSRWKILSHRQALVEGDEEEDVVEAVWDEEFDGEAQGSHSLNGSEVVFSLPESDGVGS